MDWIPVIGIMVITIMFAGLMIFAVIENNKTHKENKDFCDSKGYKYYTVLDYDIDYYIEEKLTRIECWGIDENDKMISEEFVFGGK